MTASSAVADWWYADARRVNSLVSTLFDDHHWLGRGLFGAILRPYVSGLSETPAIAEYPS
ncbi:MAG: hypothetical protein ACYCV7_04485 [Acidimicrobiales bacterium]